MDFNKEFFEMMELLRNGALIPLLSARGGHLRWRFACAELWKYM